MNKGLFAGICVVSFYAGLVHASDARYGLLSDEYIKASFDFAAPVVQDTADVSDKQIGMIVFDVSSGTFKGYSSAGTWDAMTIPGGGQVTSAGSSERLERLTFGNGSGAACTSSPCTQERESGNWVSSVARNGAGDYTVSFSGVFTAAPTCVCNSTGVNSQACAITSLTSNSFGVVTTVAPTGSTQDALVQVVCVGPR